MATGDDSAFHRMERTGWEAAAPHYGFFERATRFVVPGLLAAARVREGTRVLDLASGTGSLAAAARERGARPCAVDRSHEMARAFAATHARLPIVLADGSALPFPDGAFDAVVAAFYLNHLDDPAAGVREMCRATRPGGWVATAVWDDPGRARLNGLITEAIARARVAPVAPGPAHPLPRGRAGLARVLREAGLVDVEAHRVSGTFMVTDADELLDGLAASTVRTAALLHSHDDQVSRRIRNELRRSCEPHRSGDRLHIPTAAVIVSGRREHG